MYTTHFGLNKLPFENVPDPVFFFDQGDHARIRKRITESLKAGRGLILVTGPVGSGKTTLSQMLISDFSHEIKHIWMAEPPGNSTDLFLFIAQELGLQPSRPDRTFVLRDIRDALLKLNAEDSKCLVIIDESHLMSDDTVNGVRLLNNLEEGSKKLIQILLLGQEEIMETIKKPEMEPFRQRIATLEILGKMNGTGIREYISHRVHMAGGNHSIFSDTGWEALDKAFGSGSTPRVINSLCDSSLTVAFEREKTRVDIDDVYEAAQKMGLQKEIFFYKVALKQRERQAPSVRQNNSRKKSEKTSKKPVHSFHKESYAADAEQRNRQSETVQSTRKGFDTAFSTAATEKKGLKMPILSLLLSIGALVLSIFFYCQRSGSPDLMTCLDRLISF